MKSTLGGIGGAARGRIAAWQFNRAIAALGNGPSGALQDYALAHWPEPQMPALEAPFLALDFELDGLKQEAHLLQAGWVQCTATSVKLASAVSRDIRSLARLDDHAVTIHGIGEQRAADGTELPVVLDDILKALSGRVLIAHAADIEIGALKRTTRKLFHSALHVRSVCTLRMERALNPHLHEQGAYRLGAVRSRYGLPEYEAHDALSDAIAAAELFQAQLTRLPNDTTLGALEAL